MWLFHRGLCRSCVSVHALRILVLTLIVGVTACRWSTIGQNDNLDPTTPEQFATRVMQQVCDALATCCDAGQLPFERSACEASYRNQYANQFGLQDSGGHSFDPAAGQRCLAEIAQNMQGCLAPALALTARGAPYLTPECDSIFVGTVPLGGECSLRLGCALDQGRPTACDSESWVCVLDTRDAAPQGKLGDRCTSTCIGSGLCITGGVGAVQQNDLPPCYVSSGLYCSNTSQCVPLGGVGASCQGSDECTDDTYCDFQTLRCATRLTLGAACQNDLDCASNYCSTECALRPLVTQYSCLVQIAPPPFPDR